MEQEKNSLTVWVAKLILYLSQIIPILLVDYILPIGLLLIVWDYTLVRAFGIKSINFLDALFFVLLLNNIFNRKE